MPKSKIRIRLAKLSTVGRPSQYKLKLVMVNKCGQTGSDSNEKM